MKARQVYFALSTSARRGQTRRTEVLPVKSDSIGSVQLGIESCLT